MAQAVNCWKAPNPSLDEHMVEYWNKKHYQQIHANQVTQCWRQRSLHNEVYLQQVTSHNQKKSPVLRSKERENHFSFAIGGLTRPFLRMSSAPFIDVMHVEQLYPIRAQLVITLQWTTKIIQVPHILEDYSSSKNHTN